MVIASCCKVILSCRCIQKGNIDKNHRTVSTSTLLSLARLNILLLGLNELTRLVKF